jgi:hypothetical protein
VVVEHNFRGDTNPRRERKIAKGQDDDAARLYVWMCQKRKEAQGAAVGTQISKQSLGVSKVERGEREEGGGWDFLV